MNALETGLVIVAVGGWLLALCMWIWGSGAEDALIEARAELRKQVFARLEAEQASGGRR